MYNLILMFILGLLFSFFSMPIIIKYMQKKKIVGIDIHKLGKPIVAEMGGISVLIGLIISISSAIILFPEKITILGSFLSSVCIAGVIGAIDDVKTLNSKVKPFLTSLAGLPILLFNSYDPIGPIFPLIGQTRLTMVYPLLIPLAIAVTSNSTNMMDPFNGTMSGSTSIVMIVLLISAAILGRDFAVVLCVCSLGPLLILYYYNRFPSKVFSGDVGSLSIGAAIGAIAIIGRIEVVAIVALAPQIMNAFYGLSTIGRLYERREVSRPIKILNDGRLAASKDPRAPITLARVVLARGPLKEKEAVKIFLLISFISGFLAIITALLMVVTV